MTAEEVDYLPFGGFLTGGPQPSTTHLFTGHERDTAQLASNLDYMHARYFSPNLGQFLSVNPAATKPGGSQGWNRYSYVLNNPMLFVDPDGLEVKLEFQDLVDQAEFLKQLERKTGLNLDVKDGFLGAVGTFTNNQGQQIGSEAARTALEAFIGSEAVSNITGVNGDPNVWGAQQGPGKLDVTIDMADVSAIQAGGNGRATMDSAIIALHERWASSIRAWPLSPPIQQRQARQSTS